MVRRRWWGRLLVVLSVGLVWLWATPLPAMAAVHMQEGAGQMRLEASATISDRQGQTWQVVVYQHPQAAPEAGDLTLALRSLSGEKSVSLTTPLQIQPPGKAVLEVLPTARGTALDQPRADFDIQYDLQSIWPRLQGEERLTLILPVRPRPVELPISPSFYQEWHTVASCRALLCV